MIEPTLNYVTCPGPAVRTADAPERSEHRMAYWEWNATGNPAHPHVIVCVHGLTRQGRDFDVLARALAPHARVICPDVAGRGRSEWLADPQHYAVPQYALDMLMLLQHLQAQAPLQTLDWIGTSMGGLIGMALAGQAQLPLPVPIRRLVLNDVGPTLEWAALQRIGSYVGQPVRFASVEEAAATLRVISAGFGPHTDAEWRALTEPMLAPLPDGGLGLHYDPAIGVALRGMTREEAEQGQTLMWQLYDQITAQTLLLRGEQSDLLTAATAQAMQERGPRAQCVVLANVGHAPTLVSADQVAVVRDFVLAQE
ncbi:alpha/beta fold hydrolase [Comamonas terrigena]|uniref:alpha/beta fold hydrolase n=1 Tax=Comamonas terrigena TaxID=32013 RepID=UPI002448CAE3|nr:alpha/beta hydrolase [Comamonas terrigena]MDH1703909.1 alpha/beta hydrolase [Comamonas terrigena]